MRSFVKIHPGKSTFEVPSPDFSLAGFARKSVLNQRRKDWMDKGGRISIMTIRVFFVVGVWLSHSEVKGCCAVCRKTPKKVWQNLRRLWQFFSKSALTFLRFSALSNALFGHGFNNSAIYNEYTMDL